MVLHDSPLPGALFAYRATRRWLRRRRWLVGKIVGFEPMDEVVHVATLFESQRDGILETDVGFMPMGRRAFEASVIKLLDTSLPTDSSIAALLSWRRRRAEQGDASYFSISIAEAEALARETLRQMEPEATRATRVIDYAFPVGNASVGHRVLEISASDRSRHREFNAVDAPLESRSILEDRGND